nr:exo-alpha-sialidase [Terriglobales bacterium]
MANVPRNSSLLILSVMFVVTLTLSASAQVQLTKTSTDPFTNSDSQHATEVEPDTFSFGNTIVSAFQQGRFNTGGGCSDIGWATSLDGGKTWQHGSLPGITTIEGSGPYERVSDAAVAYDAAHSVWMIGSLPLSEIGKPLPPMLINRSTDGITWDKPVTVGSRTFPKPDKTWVACDNNVGSPFYGHCYAEFDDNGSGDLIYMSTSNDGGLTWSAPVQPVGDPVGLGGQPLIKPGGKVIVPSPDAFLSSFIAFGSSDGGAHW